MEWVMIAKYNIDNEEFAVLWLIVGAYGITETSDAWK